MELAAVVSEGKRKLFMKEGCGVSQTWRLKKRTAGEDVITVIRASNMKTFCPFHRTGLALFACAGHAHGRVSPHSLDCTKYRDKAIFGRQRWGCTASDSRCLA